MPLPLIVGTNLPPPTFVLKPLPPLYEFYQYGRCQSCDTVVVIQAPLLVTNFGGSPPLLFVPSPGATHEEGRAELSYLLERLRDGAPHRWERRFLAKLETVTRRDLPALWRL